MKKFIVFLTLLSFPFSVLAYSNEVILGGNTIGIDIKNNGIMIIGFYKVNNSYPSTDLVEGDIITKINDVKVTSISELTKAIEESITEDNNVISITYTRGNKEKETSLELIYSDGVYKTGLYVKDSITGIGTLTFIDPKSNTYGALGHEIVENNTSKIIDIRTGTIFKNSITSIKPSKDGTPGSKNAKFYFNTQYGDITKNTKFGIYGNYEANYDEDNLISIAQPEEVKIGKASIYTVLNNEEVEEFEIYITNINEKSEIKNLTFEITDKKLLNETGGIVQGMSGSPIIQNGKIIGAVTHVIIDNPLTGYGIFITTMLEEGEKKVLN